MRMPAPSCRSEAMESLRARGAGQRRRRRRESQGRREAAGNATSGRVSRRRTRREGLGGAHAPVAPIRSGDQPAQRHQQRTKPYIADQWLVLDAHTPRCAAQWIAQRDEKVTRPSDRNRGFGHGAGLDAIGALLWLQDPYQAAIARHLELALYGAVIWSFDIAQATEGELIAANFG